MHSQWWVRRGNNFHYLEEAAVYRGNGHQVGSSVTMGTIGWGKGQAHKSY